MDNSKKNARIFIVTLLVIVSLFAKSMIGTNIYNKKRHTESFSGPGLFSVEEAQNGDVTVKAVARSSTWGKIFDVNNEGLTENNFQAFTYDFIVENHTKDQVLEFSFTLSFDKDIFLASAWNGSLEIHQNVQHGEVVEYVPDLREFVPDDPALETMTVEGEWFIAMHPGDYLVYTPSTTTNAKEMPIERLETVVPGIILYAPNGENIEGSTLTLEYQFHRLYTSDPLFWISTAFLGIWLIAMAIEIITSLRVRKYKERHERDNKIINESIETFTCFIDAKDEYTNGHSKRVATYTKMIAEEMGYKGEELERIYYIALLHDCGKIAVPDNILTKPTKLTKEEFEIIKSHTTKGAEILRNFKSMKNVGEGALYHHERYDGKGYPEGRKGEDIPVIARMICVADAFDAMNSNRIYRDRRYKEYILKELIENKGKQFDPQITDVMLGLLKDGKIFIGQ